MKYDPIVLETIFRMIIFEKDLRPLCWALKENFSKCLPDRLQFEVVSPELKPFKELSLIFIDETGEGKQLRSITLQIAFMRWSMKATFDFGLHEWKSLRFYRIQRLLSAMKVPQNWPRLTNLT